MAGVGGGVEGVGGGGGWGGGEASLSINKDVLIGWKR